jgi:hypothetical protein
VHSTEAALTFAQSTQTDFTNTLGGKLFLAVVGALLSLGATLYVNRRTATRQRRRLTWSAAVDSQALTIPADVREKVSLRYEDQPVADLASISCTVSNDSRQGVRNHQLRFPTPDGGRILDLSVRPPAEPERGFEDLSDPSRLDEERVVRFGYLGPDETISFLLVASGGDWLRWSGPRSSNPTEDIEFERRDVAQQSDDREHVRPFIFWSVILFFQSSVLGLLPSYNLALLPSPQGVIGALIFLVFLLPHLGPVSRLVASAVTASAQRHRQSVQIETFGNSIVLYDTTSSAERGIVIYPPPEDIPEPSDSQEQRAAD